MTERLSPRAAYEARLARIIAPRSMKETARRLYYRINRHLLLVFSVVVLWTLAMEGVVATYFGIVNAIQQALRPSYGWGY